MSSAPASYSSNSQHPAPKTLEAQNPGISNQSDNYGEKGRISEEERENGGESEEEEEGECGFCLFMKGGGCKDAFIAWENCVEEAEKNKEDIVEKCFQVTGNLKKCMEAHSDYYEPILSAEKASEQEFRQVMEKKNDDQNVGSKGIEKTVEIEVPKDGWWLSFGG